jgi:hypothetical protein
MMNQSTRPGVVAQIALTRLKRGATPRPSTRVRPGADLVHQRGGVPPRRWGGEGVQSVVVATDDDEQIIAFQVIDAVAAEFPDVPVF